MLKRKSRSRYPRLNFFIHISLELSYHMYYYFGTYINPFCSGLIGARKELNRNQFSHDHYISQCIAQKSKCVYGDFWNSAQSRDLKIIDSVHGGSNLTLDTKLDNFERIDTIYFCFRHKYLLLYHLASFIIISLVEYGPSKISTQKFVPLYNSFKNRQNIPTLIWLKN